MCFGASLIPTAGIATGRLHCAYVIIRPFGYERVYLPLSIVADTPFHIQGDDIILLVTPSVSLLRRDIAGGQSAEKHREQARRPGHLTYE